MTPTLFLRIASGITLVFALGHTSGALDSWSPNGETEVLKAMKSVRFDVMGVERTYWHFYFGFGLLISVLMILQAVWLWQLGSLAKHEPARVRPMVWTVLVASIACAVLDGRYIFPVPVLFQSAITLALVLALYGPGRQRAAVPAR